MQLTTVTSTHRSRLRLSKDFGYLRKVKGMRRSRCLEPRTDSLQEASLWTARQQVVQSSPGETGTPLNDEMVDEFINQCYLKLAEKGIVLQLEDCEVSEPALNREAFDALSGISQDRSAVPIALRPGVFSADEVVAELNELRKKHGPGYGRARYAGLRLPIAE